MRLVDRSLFGVSPTAFMIDKVLTNALFFMAMLQSLGRSNGFALKDRPTLVRTDSIRFASSPSLLESQKKKLKTGGTAGGSQRAEQDLDVPTLGQVAQEERFRPLHELLKPVEKTPVDKLGPELRSKLEEKGGDDLDLLLASFFDECGARAAEAARKWAHVASEEHSPDVPADAEQRARLLLETIRDLKGSPVKHKVQSEKISSRWALRDRDKARKEIIKAAKNNLKRFREKDAEKRDWNAVVVTGAAGSGKTRLCNESFGWIESAVSEGVSQVLSVFITFLNGEHLTSADAVEGVDVATQASIAVGIRVASKLFPLLGVCGSMTLRSLRAGLGKRQVLCELPTVMRACSLHLEAAALEHPVWVTMVLDEAHYAEHPEEEGAPQFWGAMMSAIMQYVIPGAERALCLEDKVVLFPMISSTWSIERQKHHWSPGNKIFAPLPPLSPDSVAFFVGQLDEEQGRVWANDRMRHFLVSCALIPDGLALALETAIESGSAGHAELTKQVCLAFARRYKGGTMVRRELAELALSGVCISNLEVDVDGRPLRHWLECGFASCGEGEPVSIPFPALFNEAGPLVPGISQFTNFGQPFHWQDFEALVPHIIRLRCSSLYRLKGDRRATLGEIFGSGPPTVVQLLVDVSVVTCSKQWLVPKRGKVKTVAQQLKVSDRDSCVEVGGRQLAFGSCSHVFAAADGNVHFDGHVSFEAVDGRSVVVCYQVKRTHITDNVKVAHFNWAQIEVWLSRARELMAGYAADVKLFVVVTNKEIHGLPGQLDEDFVPIHRGNLGTFFSPCLLASAALARDDGGGQLATPKRNSNQ